MNLIKIFSVSFVIFLIIDFIWLGFFAKNMYQKELGNLLSKNPNFIAAVIFYILYIIALIYFVIYPGLESNDLKTLVISSVIFGAITYATYDLTNLATLKDWSLKITIIDIIWGSLVTLTTSFLTFIALKK